MGKHTGSITVLTILLLAAAGVLAGWIPSDRFAHPLVVGGGGTVLVIAACGIYWRTRQAPPAPQPPPAPGSHIARSETPAFLESSHRLLVSLLEAVPDLLIVIDKNYRIVYTNDKHPAAVHPSEGQGPHTCHGRFRRLDGPCGDCGAPTVFETGRTVTRQIVDPDDGRTREVRLFPIFGEQGDVDMVVEHVRDITADKLAEAQIRRNQARLASLVSIMQNRFDSVQEFLDRALEEALGLSESKIGYIYHYCQDRKELVLNSWSKDVMKECTISSPQTCYALNTTGIWGEAVRQGRPIVINDFQADHLLKKGYPEGHAALTNFRTVPVMSSGRIVAVVGVANKPGDYTQTDVLQLTLLMEAVWKMVDRRQAEEKLSSEKERFRILVDASPFGVSLIGMDGGYKYVNKTFVEMFGWCLEDIACGADWFRKAFPDPEYRKTVISTWMDDQAKGSTGETRPRIFTVKCKDRTKKVIHFRPVRLQSGDELIIYEDITEKRQLEAQLLQARKMESVGRLAGGLAHDFNNMLQAILGQTELALLGIGPEDPLYNHFQHIRSSAWRSADLVRQLLAFARKQTIRPKVMDLNATVAGMLNMLGRLIGENIDLTWKPGPELWHVRIDPSQIDQILANLAVNARDAIGGVGKITIETRNIELDSAYCADHVGFVTGFYVMLAVSDNGCGMDRRTLDQIFEPFFSTKVVGKGTGLGLATVYGIVKQNSGFINVYSEPGYGTTFKIYLPRIAEALSPAAAENQDAKIPTGTETLLIVEDDQAILALAMSILQGLGYHVLAANSPSRAQQLGQSYSGNIHLLLTDVVMPEMNGRDLARELLSIQPAMKCLFMSGYTANVIAHHGVLDEEVFFIQKPFSVAELAIKVRRVLDGRQAA